MQPIHASPAPPTTEAIPRILHYVWVGPSPVPAQVEAIVAQWRAVMPDYAVRSWRNEDLDFSIPYIRDAMAARAWNRVSDYQRMLALRDHGGIYLDTDVEVVRRFDPLLRHECFLGFQLEEHASDLVNGAVLGAAPGHWLPGEALAGLDRMGGAENVGSFSGPGLLTQILRGRGLDRFVAEGCEIDGVAVCPKAYFYPYSWEETFHPSVVTPDTFAIHHWDNSWNPADLRERVSRKIAGRVARYSPLAAKALNALFRAGVARSTMKRAGK